MGPEKLDLSKREQRVMTATALIMIIGEFALRVVGNTTGVWWPGYTLAALAIVFTLVVIVYLARTRQRSIGSVFLLGVPDRLRRWRR